MAKNSAIRVDNFIQTTSLYRMQGQLFCNEYIGRFVNLVCDEYEEESLEDPKPLKYKKAIYKIVVLGTYSPVSDPLNVEGYKDFMPPAYDPTSPNYDDTKDSSSPTYIEGSNEKFGWVEVELGGKVPFKSTIRMTNQPYLYEGDYFSEPNWNDASSFLDGKYFNGACSGYVRDNKFYRSYDFLYNDSVTFIVHAHNLGFVGVASGISSLTKEVVDSNEDNEFYDYLPYMCVDGINRRGIAVATFMLHREGNRTDQGGDKKRIISKALNSYLLTNLKECSVAGIHEVIDEICVYMPQSNDHPEYNSEFHWLISDGNKTFCLEYVENASGKFVPSILDISDKPYITNFYLTGFDGTKDTLNAHAAGFERYKLIQNDDVELEDIAYTHTYSLVDTDKVWRSDYNDVYYNDDGSVFADITKDTPDNDPKLLAIMATAKDRYENNWVRGNGMWQSQHFCVYDFKTHLFKIGTQENYNIWWPDSNNEHEKVTRVEELGLSEGVEGTVLRHGNDIHFHFHYKALDTPINVVATSMPKPFAGTIPEFVVTRTTIESSISSVATIDADGKLSFRDDDELGEFTVDGAYYSRDFLEAKGYSLDNYEEIEIYEDSILGNNVEGNVTHFGNLISFTFSRNGATTPITTIAENLPLPITDVNNKFVVTLSDGTTTYANLGQNGTLKFDNIDGYNDFVVNGFYYSKNYEDFMGLDISMEKGIKQLTILPEAIEAREYQQIHYIGNDNEELGYRNNTIYICTRVPAELEGELDTFKWKEVSDQVIEIPDIENEKLNVFLKKKTKGIRLYQYKEYESLEDGWNYVRYKNSKYTYENPKTIEDGKDLASSLWGTTYYSVFYTRDDIDTQEQLDTIPNGKTILLLAGKDEVIDEVTLVKNRWYKVNDTITEVPYTTVKSSIAHPELLINEEKFVLTKFKETLNLLDKPNVDLCFVYIGKERIEHLDKAWYEVTEVENTDFNPDLPESITNPKYIYKWKKSGGEGAAEDEFIPTPGDNWTLSNTYFSTLGDRVFIQCVATITDKTKDYSNKILTGLVAPLNDINVIVYASPEIFPTPVQLTLNTDGELVTDVEYTSLGINITYHI